MTEDEAQAWITERCGEHTLSRLQILAEQVAAENNRQNLISPATVGSIWARHIVDSAQLLSLAPSTWRTWLDIGTGGGFPGMVVALLAPERHVMMVEPRSRRAAFLQQCANTLALPHAMVLQCKIQMVTYSADVISARAVAPLEKLLCDAAHCAKVDTTWLLPRGRSGVEELGSRHTMFHVEHSLTDRGSTILVGQGKPV